MKLLIYSHFFAPSVGGVESIVRSLASGLAVLRSPENRPEFDVTLVTNTPKGDFDDTVLGFRVIRRPGIRALSHLIRDHDVLHVAGPSLAPLFLARLHRKPMVVEHHGYQAVCPTGVLLHLPDNRVCPGHFQQGNYRECVRCHSHDASAGRSVRDLLLQFPRTALSRDASVNLCITTHVQQRQRLPRSEVIYYGIADPGEMPAAPAVNKRICFAYVGRLVPEKGLPLLVEAAARLRQEGFEFETKLVGDGPERSALEATAKQKGLGDEFRTTGFLTGNALVQALASVDVVVMPSIWEETAGLSAIEQMTRGRLVIAAAIGGLGEVVGAAGLTFPPGDAEGLAECMRRVLRDPSLIQAMGSRARDVALQRFGLTRMIEEHADVYRQLASGGGNPAAQPV